MQEQEAPEPTREPNVATPPVAELRGRAPGFASRAPAWGVSRAPGLTPALAMQLQAGAGNAAVTGLVARQAGAAAEPAATATAPPAAAAAAPAQAEEAVDPALEFIAGYARRVPGYTLLTHAIGADPITGRRVAGEGSLLREVVALVPGGAELMQRLEQSGAIDRAGPWLQQEIQTLNLSYATIAQLFERAWDSITAWDLFDPAAAWERLAGIFGPPIDRVIAFAERAAEKLLELALEAMLAAGGGAAEQVLGILRRAGAAFGAIARDPLGFARNLIAAVRGGFEKFLENIGTHLQRGLIGWLTGALQGVLRLPQRLDFEGIVSLVTEILGLTWERVRERLVRLIGPRRVGFLERTVDFVRAIADRGLGAAWEKIMEFASGLADQVFEAIRNWIAESVIGAALRRLATMFNPVGALINAVIAIYDTIQFVIERARQIGDLIDAVSTSISEIASGAIGRAVDAVEAALGRAVPVAISFLAELIGLDNVGDRVRQIIERARETIDNAIDSIIEWIKERFSGRREREGGDAGADGEGEQDEQAAEAEAPFQAGNERHRLWIDHSGSRPRVMVASEPQDMEHYFAALQRELDGEPEPTKQELRGKIATATAQTNHAEATQAGEDLRALAATMTEIVNVGSVRNVSVNQPALLAEYERLADRKLPWYLDLVLADHQSSPTPTRQRLVQLEADLRALMGQVQRGAELTPAQRERGLEILREARRLARQDFGNVQEDVWGHLRADEELQAIEARMRAAGDVGPGEAALQVRTVRRGVQGYQSLELEHSTRLSDNPFRYNARDNLMVTDSFQNQQYNEALRRHAGVWATDEIEEFVIYHRLNDQGLDFMRGR